MDFSLISDNSLLLDTHTFTFKSDIKKSDKLPVLMPTKDHLSLLKHNLEILKKFGVIQDIQLIIIDDRSTEDIRGFCSYNNLGYVRIDNDYGFNYSVNMNIGAWFLYNLG